MPASDHLVGGKEDKQRRAGHGLRKDEGWTWEERRSSRERWGKLVEQKKKNALCCWQHRITRHSFPFTAFKCRNKKWKSKIQSVDERITRPRRDGAVFCDFPKHFWMFLLPSAVILIFSPLCLLSSSSLWGGKRVSGGGEGGMRKLAE